MSARTFQRTRFVAVLWIGFFCTTCLVVAQQNRAESNSPNRPPTKNEDSEKTAAQTPAIDLAHRREFLLKTVTQADQIPDEKSRSATQWQLVYSLLNHGLKDEAFQQALKLQKSNPHTCILSLSRLAIDAFKHGDIVSALKSLNTAIKVNQESKTRYNNDIISLCFKINRPLSESIAIASAARPNNQARAFGNIRDELARRGRVDEAYQIANTHLPQQPKVHHDRQIAYSCASAKHYDYHFKHDHYGQAIQIIKQMPEGKHRDFVIARLINNLFYVTGDDVVPEHRVVLAEQWADKIQDEGARGTARKKILKFRLAASSVKELEQKFSELFLREEKKELLSRIFDKLLSEGRLDEADAILPREIKLIKDQPRPVFKGEFGSYSDDDSIRWTTWMHEKKMVIALIKAGKKDEARARVDALKDLPDSKKPITFFGSLFGLRQSLYLELEDYDAVKIMFAEKEPAERDGYKLVLAMHFVSKGQLDRGLKLIESSLDRPPEQAFPRESTNYFSVYGHQQFAKAFAEAGRIEVALRFLNQIPEYEKTARAFESFGEVLVRSNRISELDQWLARLPHETARTHARMGALREMSKPLK